jgi:Domain of unknown function (DUF6371)
MQHHAPPILQPYKGRNTRHTCPQCGKAGEFTRYIDPDTGQHLHPTVGKCNRATNCGYHYAPRQFFADHPDSRAATTWQPQQAPSRPMPAPPLQYSKMDPRLIAQSRGHYHLNNFIKWLQSLFGVEVAAALADTYYIGTSKHWAGATVFWQVDAAGQVRAGKIMHYSPDTGRRTKQPHSLITWVHSALQIEGYHLRQCLFGEHLISQGDSRPVAIVESEKTAIVCSAFMPRFVWLATGGLGNLQADLFKPLRGREIVLFPDLGARDHWQEKAALLGCTPKPYVSDYLEVNAPPQDRAKGYDLADYFVRPDPMAGFALTVAGYPAFWDMATPSPSPTAPSPASVAEPSPATADPLAGMIAQNPALLHLIARFDLQPVTK